MKYFVLAFWVSEFNTVQKHHLWTGEIRCQFSKRGWKYFAPQMPPKTLAQGGACPRHYSRSLCSDVGGGPLPSSIPSKLARSGVSKWVELDGQMEVVVSV